MRLVLYPFRYRDPLTEKWIRARYVAEVHEIAARYTEWEITGPAEIRTGEASSFSPFCRSAAHLPPVEEPPPDHGPMPDPPPAEEPPPIEDQLERFLVLLFLRRYVTWCARSQHYDRMKRAAGLWRNIRERSARTRLLRQRSKARASLGPERTS